MEFLNPTFINTILIVITGIILFFDKRKDNSGKINDEVIKAYEKQVNQLKEEVKQLRDIQEGTSRQMTELQKTMDVKDTQIKTLTDLLQNRNPELVALITDVKSFLVILEGKLDDFFTNIAKESHQQTDYLKTAKERHDEIDREFGPQLLREVKARQENTERSKRNEERNLRIDKNTDRGEGNIMRKK
jgi:Sec-independent protein translocase protein TatA